VKSIAIPPRVPSRGHHVAFTISQLFIIWYNSHSADILCTDRADSYTVALLHANKSQDHSLHWHSPAFPLHHIHMGGTVFYLLKTQL
jgi:hypothetical protein